MDTTLSPVGNHEQSPIRLRLDLLERLHWDVFGSLEDIQVKNKKDILTPFSGHRIASESLANPPFTNIEVNIDRCTQKAALDETNEDEDPYEAPEPLVINKEDGSPISLQDFVFQVHEYLNANKEQLYKCEDEMYMNPVALGDGQQAVEVNPNDGEGVPDGDEDAPGSEDESMERDHFLRSGNIPEGNRFFFDHAMLNEVDTYEYDIYVSVFVEGHMGLSLEKFLARKLRP
ncbi:uncharacterized protein K460DRAFT_290793 [Cucurbitaria berberidis CBS 394.84]|uniref:Uncharacterized protein n=1 Tax=Cucurbitaria berberidis CBS 394.84 TaxID=1168544 RepID=A0A9P4L7L1_9PLEO|nr:uncharacterized protein K460DRAFT_290793 [Cucurbitaria berberidis CBS 394.84]KAF1844223.1 hypothetical protein K460DRAFT_290793 [Cucurbitaria berberidis CBS 394.84]